MSNLPETLGTSGSPIVQRAPTNFQPRIVRGTVARESPANTLTVNTAGGPRPNPTPASPTRPRRMSATSTPLPRIHRISASGAALGPTLGVMGSTTQPTAFPLTFPRPSYLNYSSLRARIHSQPPPTASPNKYRLEGLAASQRIPSGASQQLRRPEAAPTPETPSPEDSEDDRGPNRSGIAASRRARKLQQHDLDGEQFKLPTRWNERDRHQLLHVSPDGREVTFTGSTQGDKEAAGVRANFTIPPACGIYYYEVEIVSRGTKGHIGIGLGTSRVRLSRLPGWEHDSWGYHGDDGNVFSTEGETPYGPKFTTGDIIGCGVDYSVRRAFYTKNGVFLGLVFNNLPDGLFPLVGLRTSNESVRANFGHQPFLFDIDSHVQQVRNNQWAKVMRTQLEWTVDASAMAIKSVQDDLPNGEPNPEGGQASSSNVPRLPPLPPLSEGLMDVVRTPSIETHQPAVLKGKEPDNDIGIPIRELVLDYLVHHGYASTALAFKSQTDRERQAEIRCSEEIQLLAAARANAENVAARSNSKRALAHARNKSSIGMAEFLMSDSPVKPDSRQGFSASATPPVVGTFAIPQTRSGEMDSTDTVTRQQIINAVLRGDVDYALEETAKHYPKVLLETGSPLVGDGLMTFKLRCRKLVELVLEAAEANPRPKISKLRRKSLGTFDPAVRPITIRERGENGSVATDAMDIDFPTTPSFSATATQAVLTAKQKQKQKEAEGAASSRGQPTSPSYMDEALAYGRQLHSDYRNDTRPAVQALFKRASSLMAYEDPLDPNEAGEETAQFSGQHGRDELAEELHKAILDSQGRRLDSTLERLYRQTAAAVLQLGLLGEGQAAFADVEREFTE